jgi:2'-hydroxyisoflavone reductase
MTGPVVERISPRGGLRILVLGGTSFLGPPQVTYALGRGHEVTLFNRGQTNADLFPEVEKLRGDRNGDLESLRGRSWDVVIDNSATNPAWVRATAGLLQGSVDHYIYVSSISAYRDMGAVPMTASEPVFTYENAGVPADQDEAELPYGLSKAQAEREAEIAFPGKTTIVRPGLIVGPMDATDRFTYWPARVHRGGEILSPGDGTDPVQLIDARDLGEWMIRLAEDVRIGVFNGLGPPRAWSMAELLYGIRAVTSTEASFTWVPTEFLAEMGVRPWGHMPVWIPPEGTQAGASQFDISPEVDAGLTFRPLAETARDTLEYHLSRPAERQAELRAGISPEREAEVLAAWRARGRGADAYPIRGTS